MRLPKPRRVGRRPKPPRGYDSFLEYDLHKGPLRGCKHHVDKVKYTIEREYEPDFVFHDKKEVILIESKGRFRDSGEANKYVWIAKALPKKYRLVFIFQNPDLPMPFVKRRKDGTKRSHKEWAEKNNFTWYSVDDLPPEWAKGK